MDKTSLRTQILLIMQSSLLGMITKNMEAISVSWDESNVNVRIFLDRVPTSDDEETAGLIETEILSHLPAHEVQCRIELRAQLEKITLHGNEQFVFQRAS